MTRIVGVSRRELVHRLGQFGDSHRITTVNWVTVPYFDQTLHLLTRLTKLGASQPSPNPSPSSPPSPPGAPGASAQSSPGSAKPSTAAWRSWRSGCTDGDE